MYNIANILHFKKYFFTDTNKSAPHFALVLLPPAIMNYEHNLLCSVITSKKTFQFSVVLSKDKYRCFSKDSYICFNRRDTNSIHDLSNKQPLGKLDRIDIKKSFKVLKCILYGTNDAYLMATIVREWKKIK